MARGQGLGWLDIVRLGLVQSALGAIAVITTSTLNRVMVVELSIAALVPGILVGVHYGVQISRPLFGHGSDSGSRRTPWIIAGMGLLALSGVGATVATAIMAAHFWFGFLLALVDFTLIGMGIGAAGTSLLALMAGRTAPERRPGAATIVWLMMIAGMAITAVISGRMLDPFSLDRLVAVSAVVSCGAFALAVLAIWGIEARVVAYSSDQRAQTPAAGKRSFRSSLSETWADPQARLFTIFVFVSMLAYSAQDLILEPFAGLVFAMTPGETTTLSGLQNAGVFIGMVAVGLGGSLISKRVPGFLAASTVAGCLASATALGALALASARPEGWPLTETVFLLGVSNGVFAVAAIASMMALAGGGRRRRDGQERKGGREGMRMGLWGASQAIAFGLGGLAGTIAVDLVEAISRSSAIAYGSVFLIEALLFVAAAAIALRVTLPQTGNQPAETRSIETREPSSIQPAE
jgi:BCD family chlorophyll transporter-like MFS transporter